jgi:hypothetical protein
MVPDCPRITRPCRITLAKTSSLLGRARSFSRVCASSPAKDSAAIRGDIRSGSGNSTSKPIAIAPSPCALATSSAMIVRGHGHCPIAAMLASSMSMMTTGFWVGTRGLID